MFKKTRKSRLSPPVSYLTDQDRKRRKREIIIIITIILTVIILTIVENRLIRFGVDFPISNTILMFILININLLLLILLIFLVFRNLVKLLYDRKRRVMGSKLRTKLVVAFITLTLVPTTVLFFFSVNFITSSIQFWFNIPIEQALENSLVVGRRLYELIEEQNRFYIERLSYQIKTKNLLDLNKADALLKYIQLSQKSFNLHGIEVYSINGKRLVVSDDLSNMLKELTEADLYQKRNSKNIRSFSMMVSKGEIYRTIGTIPFSATDDETEAFVVISTLIRSDISESLAAISKGIEGYQQVKLLKEPIRLTYYISISIVALVVVFCAIWFGFYLAKTISIPIKELAEGTRRVAEGDLDFKIEMVADDEIGSLVDSFNRMTQDLRIGRDQLEQSAKKLKEQNIEIEERRRYMEIVLENVSTGVITLDAHGLITTTNKSAEKMLMVRSQDLIGKSYTELLRGQHLDIADEIRDQLVRSVSNSVDFPLRTTIDGSPRSFMIHVRALKDESNKFLGLVLTFDDLTEQEKAQRTAAWREVARRIAHEVKNPLTPISLSAQRLKRRFSSQLNEPVFDECTRMIIDGVELIQNLVNEFSTYARFPTAKLEINELPPIIQETVALFKEDHPHIQFHIHIAPDIPKMNIDRQQIKQAMINLVDNAIAAIDGSGSIYISVKYDVVKKIVRIEVADTGKGISDDQKIRLFEPYFSTKKSGMGLGLTIVNSIVADHHGTITVQDNHPQGAKFIIDLPAN